MSRPGPQAAVLAVSLASVIALAACGSGEGPSPDGRGRVSGTDGVAGSASARGGGRPSPTSAAGADDRGVLARRRVTVPPPPDAPRSFRASAELVVRSLTVRGRVATLRFAATTRGYGGVTPATGGAPTLYDLNPGPSSAPVTAQLVDVDHLRRHLPLEDSRGEELATMSYAGGAKDGQPIEASWMFAAPPPGVDRMDVQVGNWPVFREIPVTRR